MRVSILLALIGLLCLALSGSADAQSKSAHAKSKANIAARAKAARDAEAKKRAAHASPEVPLMPERAPQIGDKGRLRFGGFRVRQIIDDNNLIANITWSQVVVNVPGANGTKARVQRDNTNFTLWLQGWPTKSILEGKGVETGNMAFEVIGTTQNPAAAHDSKPIFIIVPVRDSVDKQPAHDPPKDQPTN